MKQETIAALQKLYCGTDELVCAATPQFQMLWQSDARAGELLPVLGRQLGGAEKTAEVPIPSDRTVVLSYVSPPVVCRIDTLSEDGERYLLIRFQPVPEKRELDLPEMRAMLYSMVTTGRQAVISVLQAFHKVEELLQANQLAADPAVERLLHEACYALLNHDVRCDELLWYENLGKTQHAPEQAAFGSINLTSELSRFLSDLHAVTDGLIHVEAAEITDDLFAQTEPRRFQFALLAMFVLLQGSDPARTGFSLCAKQAAGQIEIMMTLRQIMPPAEEPLPFRKRMQPDGTLLSEDVVLQRFCDAFGARYRVLTQAESVSGILTIPAAEPPQDRTQLGAGLARYNAGKCTLAHVMLSAVISAEYYYNSDV